MPNVLFWSFNKYLLRFPASLSAYSNKPAGKSWSFTQIICITVRLLFAKVADVLHRNALNLSSRQLWGAVKIVRLFQRKMHFGWLLWPDFENNILAFIFRLQLALFLYFLKVGRQETGLERGGRGAAKVTRPGLRLEESLHMGWPSTVVPNIPASLSAFSLIPSTQQ